MTLVPGIPGAKITIFDPVFGSPQILDASPYVMSLQYGFNPSGCAAASLSTNLTWTRIEQLGFFDGRCGVEISTLDDLLQTACAAGATKLYTGGQAAYVSAIGETMQIAIDDGSNPTYRIPVTGTGADAGGSYITIGAPIAGTGNNTTLPAYGAGAGIYIRRYAGRFANRTRYNDRTKKTTLTLVGIGNRLAEQVGDFAYNGYDAGLAIYQAIENYATNLTDLGVASMPKVTIGTTYTGSNSSVSIATAINNILASLPSDLWTMWMGHDRVPRLIKLFAGTTQVYSYNVRLSQQAVSVVPMEVTLTDQDTSEMANELLVIGDTDPQTQNPIQAIVTDAASIATYGSIQGDPITMTSIKDTTTAANYGQAQLNQRSYPRESGSFQIFTRNYTSAIVGFDPPTGLANGDQVFGYQNITVADFNESEGPNMVPDSGIAFGSGADALWTIVGSPTMTVATGAAPDGANAWELTLTAGAAVNAYAQIEPILVTPGNKYTFSAYVDASALSGSGTAPTMEWYVKTIQPNGTVGTTLGVTAAVSVGQARTRLSFTFSVPSNYAYLVVGCFVSQTGTGSTIAGPILFANPMINDGSSAIAFVQNVASENVYGLPSSVVTTMDAAGDVTQQITFAPVVPDINATIAERANATAAQLLANTQPPAKLDQYVVSSSAKYGLSYSGTSLGATFTTFLALFAQGTSVQQITGTTVTLTASATNYVWVNPGGTFTVKQNDPTKVAGSILLFYGTCSSTGIVGIFWRAPIGVIQITASNVSLAANLPAPTSGTVSVANGVSLNGLSADVNVSVPLTNVPSDGSASGVQFYYRLAVAAGGDGTWIPDAAINLSGLPNPAASQTVSFSYGSLTNGTQYDFAIGYVGLGGYGQLLIFKTSWAAKTITIPGSYLASGAVTATPTIASGATLTPRAGLTSVTTTIRATFTITNQPTDGSLAEISVWILRAGDSAYTPEVAVAAVGAGTASPPASGSYTIDITGIPNASGGGILYGVAVGFVSTAGALGSLTVLGTCTTQNLAIPAPYLLGGSAPAPAVQSGATITPSVALTGLSCCMTVSWTVTNQPTDGSLSQVILWVRPSTVSTYSPVAAVPAVGLGSASPPATGSYTVVVPNLINGVTYYFCCSYEDNQGGQGGRIQIGNPTAALAIGIAAPYMLGGAGTLTPTIGSGPTANSSISANGMAAAVALGFTITNQPTDGSLSRVNIWYRLSSLGGGNVINGSNFNWQPAGGMPAVGVGSSSPSSSGTYAYTVDVSPEQAYDYGVSMEDNQGEESTIAVIVSSYTAQIVTLSGVGSSRTVAGATSATTGSTSAPNQNCATLSIALPATGTDTWKISLYAQCVYNGNGGASSMYYTITSGTVSLSAVSYGPASIAANTTLMNVTASFTAAGNQTIAITITNSSTGTCNAGNYTLTATRTS